MEKWANVVYGWPLSAINISCPPNSRNENQFKRIQFIHDIIVLKFTLVKVVLYLSNFNVPPGMLSDVQ